MMNLRFFFAKLLTCFSFLHCLQRQISSLPSDMYKSDRVAHLDSVRRYAEVLTNYLAKVSAFCGSGKCCCSFSFFCSCQCTISKKNFF